MKWSQQRTYVLCVPASIVVSVSTFIFIQAKADPEQSNLL
jgi:hypothetical protein